MKFKYYISGIIIIISIALVWFFFIRSAKDEGMFKNRVGKKNTSRVEKIPGDGEVPAAAKKQPPLLCPQAKTLVKNDMKWATPDGKWTHYTTSSATKILNFQGAQWVGIKFGKIICLYTTNEAVSFPIALEYTSVRKVLEPKTAGWSSLVGGNRKFCKSINVVDCPYFVEAPKDTADIYKDIEYAPAGEY